MNPNLNRPRKVIVGATAMQLAGLDRLFPHMGGDASIVAGEYSLYSPRQRQRIVGALTGARHDTRQIRVGGGVESLSPRRIVAGLDGAWHDRRQIVGGLEGAWHDRRQIVGAPHTVDEPQQGDFVEVFLPVTAAGGNSMATTVTNNFELKPNKLFLPMALLLFPFTGLVMSNLAIGGNPCLLSTGVIPCEQFAPTTVHKPFKAWTASNAQPITFSLTNITGATIVTYGCWAGLAQV